MTSPTGALTLRPHIAHWAEAGVPLAATLLGGTEDPRQNMVEILDAAIAALPDGVEHIRTRWDAGYFAAALAQACIERGVSFAIGAKRTRPLMAAATHAPDDAWVPAIGMEHTEIAVIGYLPGTWPEDAGIRCIARRTRIPVEMIPTARARKRRTIPAAQLTLALDGLVDAVYGYSFILTDIDLTDPEDAPEDERGLALAEVEYWYRHRTDIEALNKDAKHGTALRHLPSANRAVNTVWMHAALLGCAIAAWTQELASTDHGNGRGRFTVTRFRREIIRTPARLIRQSRTILLRLPPGGHLLEIVLPRLQALPDPSG
ncbi:transposase [Microbacterium sp.]|uniref:transposase n=1 Tax=Microbacterium sp. TaxID=51671 RepID=UPI003C78430F